MFLPLIFKQTHSNTVINSPIPPLFWTLIRYIREELSREEERIIDRMLIDNEEAWELFQKLFYLHERDELNTYLTNSWQDIENKIDKNATLANTNQ